MIDVRTPSFLNVEIKLNKKDNLVEFKKRLEKIDLIDDFYVQKLNKDYVLVKIKYLGKISKIINKLKDQKINLKMIAGLAAYNNIMSQLTFKFPFKTKYYEQDFMSLVIIFLRTDL